MEISAAALWDAIAALIDDIEACERTGRIGFERMNRELNWEKSTANLLAAYQRA